MMAHPAYDQCIKASHLFNLLDARGVISVTERQAYIGRVRALGQEACADAFRTTAKRGRTRECGALCCAAGFIVIVAASIGRGGAVLHSRVYAPIISRSCSSPARKSG